MLFNTSLQSSLFHLALLTMFLSYWKRLSLAGEMWDVWRKKTQRNRLGDLTWSSHKNLKNFPWNPAWDEKILPGNSSLDKGFPIFWEEFGLLIISPFLHKMFCIWTICKCKCTKNLFWGLFFWVFFVRLYACLFVFGVTQNYWNHHWFISSITILDQDVIYQKPTLGEITQLHVTHEPGCFWDIGKFFLLSFHGVSFILEPWHRALSVRVLTVWTIIGN